MIIKPQDIKKINISRNKFILLYGKNDGLKNQIIKNLFINNKISSKHNEKEILNNKEIFLESLISESLFEKEKIIIIKDATDKILNLIDQIIQKNYEGIKIIIESGLLDKKSKLRSYFEKNKQLICIPFYPDNDQTLSKLALEFFKEKNIPISRSNINQIATKSQGDRENLYNELLKIENFSNSGKKLTDDVIKKLVNLSENHSISELTNNCLEKNKIKLIKILNENIYSNDDCILILRTLLNRSKKILTLSKEYEKNKNINLTISTARPPIFGKKEKLQKSNSKLETTKIKIINLQY